MTIIKVFALVVLFGGAASGVALAQEPFSVPVTGDFQDIDLSWDNGRTTYRGVWSVILAPDKTIAICGAGAITDASAATVTRKWLNGLKLTLNGKTILKGMGHFTALKSSADPRKSKANCVSTGVRPPKGDVKLALVSSSMSERF